MEGFEGEKVTDGGNVLHRESKIMEDEPHIIIVFDKPEDLIYHVDAYSLASAETVRKKYKYVEFDAFFRFNPELMNPNKRHERCHWLIERLQYKSDGKGGRELAVANEPTEVSEIPLATNMKMPIGRMDYAERARLREDMERLSVRRDENIKARRQKAHELFIQNVTMQKEMEEKKKILREERIHKEVNERINQKLQTLADERAAEIKKHANDHKREENIREKKQRRLDRELAETQTLLARQEKESKEHMAEEQAELDKRMELRRNVSEVAEKAKVRQLEREKEREKIARQIDERVEKKTVCLIAETQKKKKDEERWIHSIEEKKLEKCRIKWKARGELFSAVHAHEKALTEALQSEKAMAIADAKGEEPEEEKAAADEVQETGAVGNKSQAFLELEETARQKMEEEKRCKSLEDIRNQKFADQLKKKNLIEVEKARKMNDDAEKDRILLQEKQQQRSMARTEEEESSAHAKARREANRSRLDKMREENIRAKEAARFARAIQVN